MDHDSALALPAYWNEHYAKSDGEHPTHEWFKSFADLGPVLEKHLVKLFPRPQETHILHPGSGDSTLPFELYRIGYHHQICVDFSQPLVEMMIQRHKPYEGVQWYHGDVRDLSMIQSASIDFVMDKGTLDAMIHGSPWSPPSTVVEYVTAYLQEMQRVLKDDGTMLWISYRQPHFMKPLLARSSTLKLEVETLSGSEGSFDYYAYVLKNALSKDT